MCGILGAIAFDIEAEPFAKINRLMAHRGPDFARVERLQGNVLFGHNRLSIVGLEADSNQPFVSSCGRYTIVFNGEIYNYVEIRSKLQSLGIRFRTTSDTEVLLAAWVEWGKDALQSFNGMFAFAIHDRETRGLTLVRDRLGVKPLYYYWQGGRFAFSSELPPLACLAEPVSVDPIAVDAYFALGYIPGERTVYREIKKLQPGYIL